jgi:hypothetical protein
MSKLKSSGQHFSLACLLVLGCSYEECMKLYRDGTLKDTTAEYEMATLEKLLHSFQGLKAPRSRIARRKPAPRVRSQKK